MLWRASGSEVTRQRPDEFAACSTPIVEASSMTTPCSSPLASKTALVVPSGGDIDELLTIVLASGGWSIQRVIDNHQALARAKAEPFELIITGRETLGVEDIELL